MVIDVDACIGCYNCVIACKDEHVGNGWPPYSAAQPDTGHFWMNLVEKERTLSQTIKVTYIPTPCMQCRDAPCVKAAKGGAAYIRPDGIVVFDPEKARGQRQIADSCPYGVIYWNQEKTISVDGGLPQKCTFCAHLLDRGYKQPRCAESCPTHAIVFGDLEDPNSEISRIMRSGVIESLRPELSIETAVNYIGLPRPVISGSIVFEDTGDCGAGVDVRVFDDSRQMAETKTNNYGDFLVEKLNAGGRYEVRLSHPGYSPESMSVTLDDDANLGDIILRRE